jgi:hypothetical protein
MIKVKNWKMGNLSINVIEKKKISYYNQVLSLST